jgi:hypothetical protein
MESVSQASGSLAHTVRSATNGTNCQRYGGSLPRPAELAPIPPALRFCLRFRLRRELPEQAKAQETA